MAATDDTVVGGTVPATIEVSAPSTAEMGTMPVGETTTKADLITVNVKCNEAGWTLDATDEKVSDKGYMYSATLSAALPNFNITKINLVG